LKLLAARLSDLSPLAVLQRGYAVVRRPVEKRVVRSSRNVRLGERLNVLLFEGELNVLVDEVV
jgi:exodeoxyribonuclease VII large subunit